MWYRNWLMFMKNLECDQKMVQIGVNINNLQVVAQLWSETDSFYVISRVWPKDGPIRSKD